MKYILLTFLLAACTATARAQNEKEMKLTAIDTLPEITDIDFSGAPDEPTLPIWMQMEGYRIGDQNWMIFPAERAVYRYEPACGDDGDIHWEGYTYVPDERIRFDSTTLLFHGNGFGFPESAELPDPDGLQAECCCDGIAYLRGGNTLYLVENYDTESKRIDLSAMTQAGPVCYRDASGALLLLYYEFARLWKLHDHQCIFDPATLRHVAGRMYRDDRALYLFPTIGPIVGNTDDGDVIVLEQGTPRTPLRVTPDYIVYGDAVYNRPRFWEYYNVVQRLELEPERFVSLPYGGLREDAYLLTDGRRAYRSSDGREITELRDGGYSPVGSGWFYFEPDGHTLTHSGGPDRKGFLPDFGFGIVFRSPKGWLFCGEGLVERKADSVQIYNYRKAHYEPLDPTLYRQVARDCYIYDGILCAAAGPVSEQTQQKLDLDALHEIPCERFHTRFLTDGRWLFTARFTDNLIEADPTALRFPTSEIAIDRDNIYEASGYGYEIDIIPIEKLGIPVKVLTDIKK